MIPRLRISRAFAAGRLAKKQGKDWKVCPYDAESDDPIERLRLAAWLRGWRITAGP